jgi:hypothetical protein
LAPQGKDRLKFATRLDGIEKSPHLYAEGTALRGFVKMPKQAAGNPLALQGRNGCLARRIG